MTGSRRTAPTLLVLGVLTACGGGGSQAPAAPQAPPPGVIGQSPGATFSPPVLPMPVTRPVRGKRYWAVYVAVAAPGSPLLEEAVTRLRSLGVRTAPTDLSCDRGAQPALGAKDGDRGVAVYFPSKEEADAFAGALDPAPVGVAHIRVLCAAIT